MSDAEKIRVAVYRAVDAANDFLAPEQAIEANDTLVIVGENASLDSMGFVNFIVALEEELERELGRGVNIADLLNTQTDAVSVSTVADLIEVLCKRFE